MNIADTVLVAASRRAVFYDSREIMSVLKPGMTFTIEPMVNAGKKEIRTMKDGWTVKTKKIAACLHNMSILLW